MKKTLISIAAVAFVALMIANVYAQTETVGVSVPPLPCGCYGTGFTPGFWKHNIQVRLSHDPYNEDLTSGAYSAFVGYPLDGVKLTDEMMDDLLDAIHNYPYGSPPQFTFEEALAYLQGPGWSANRTNTANWFNLVAGYGPF